jgi:hypothetical protein
MHTSRYHILEAVKDLKAKLNGGKLDSLVDINFKKGELYLGNFINYVEGQWQDFNEETDIPLLVIYTGKSVYSGKVPKDIFKINEIHLDDLPDGALNILYKNAERAIMDLEKSV